MAKRKYTAQEQLACHQLVEQLNIQSNDDLRIRCDARIILAKNDMMKIVAEPMKEIEDLDLDLIDYEELDKIIKTGEYDEPYWYSKNVRMMFRKVEGARKSAPHQPHFVPHQQVQPQPPPKVKREKASKSGPGIAVALVGLMGAVAASVVAAKR